MALEPLYVVLLIVGAIASSIFGAISGFGGGLMVTPFLVPVVGFKGIVPVMTIAMIFGNGMRLWVYRRSVQPRFIGIISIAVIPGIVVGTMIYDSLSPRMAAAVIGLFLIASIPLRWALKSKPIEPTPPRIAIVGFVFGIITGSSTGAGVILLSLLLGMGLSGTALIATDAVVGVLVNLMKTVMFGGLDLIDRDRLLIGVAVGLAMMPGAFVGRWLVERLPMRVHVALIETVVSGVGIWFLWRAWRGV
ncbi:sulfite exporter TauE/SafE family protein [Microvirga antarctica]|uniref:sulfite exporter TauE/SafE family protein n=1 Tax=Microvirga antarctica TaxID=2819233 RepID=UPI001B3117C1|nr:sulfite exporter TauE/SafE family protein [Microvirga antarctica]